MGDLSKRSTGNNWIWYWGQGGESLLDLLSIFGRVIQLDDGAVFRRRRSETFRGRLLFGWKKKKKRNWLKAKSKSRVPATKKTNQWNWTLAVQRPPIGRFIFNEIGLSIDSQCPLSVHFSEPIISQSNSLSLSSYPAGIKATETKECPSEAKKPQKYVFLFIRLIVTYITIFCLQFLWI